MKAKYWIIGIGIYWAFNNLIPDPLLKGTYENVNYEQSPFYSRPDTLILFGDHEFFSPLQGYGKYEVSHNLVETEIKLLKDDEFFQTTIDRNWLGKIRIHVFHDLLHSYLKISSKGTVSQETIKQYQVIKKKRDLEIQESIREIQKRYNK